MNWLVFMALAVVTTVRAAPDIYLEDSHAGSFYWIAEHLPLTEPVGLVLVDAHSDATALPDSDALRARLKQSKEPGRLLQAWRKSGVIGCDAWIEPLMPAPVESVLWIPALHQTAEVSAAQRQEARRLLTAHAEVSARDTASHASRFEVGGLDEASSIVKTWPADRKIVVSIDLDFFAELEGRELVNAFEQVWQRVLGFDERLAAITFAVSRPWLKSDAQASVLVELALRHAAAIHGARIQVESFASTGPDSSALARTFYQRGEQPPAWNVATASESLRALLLAERGRWQVKTGKDRWDALLNSWNDEFPVPGLCLPGHQPGTDEVWHVAVDKPFRVAFDDSTLPVSDAQVRWYVLKPTSPSYNLVKQVDLGKMFAPDASSLPIYEAHRIETREPGGVLSSADLESSFDPATRCGVVRVVAELQRGNEVRRTAPIAIARSPQGKGVRSLVMEGLGLPYVFGATFLRDGEFTGAETLIGSDCANFVIAALRKAGHPIAWGAPADLRRALQQVPSDTRIDEGVLNAGLVVDFDTHMTLLMEDKGERGSVDAEDVVAHHLEGLPELISLGELMRRRSYTRFRLLQPRRPDGESIKLLFGGDVMLGRSIGERLKKPPFQPLARIRQVLRAADLAVVNLECVISEKGTPATGKRYLLRAPAAAATALADAGIDAVSLATNHSLDFGADALADMQSMLEAKDIRTFGAGKAPVEAVICEVQGVRVALVGLSAVSALSEQASADHAGVAIVADLDAMRRARRDADVVIAFMHWGVEGSRATTAEQRALSRSLAHAGADVIVGAHPHCRQPLDFFAGRPVAYSLGNLVFDGGIAGSDWVQGALLEVEIGRDSHRVLSVRLVPVGLDSAGLPGM